MQITPLTAQQTFDRARTFTQTGRGSGLPELLALIRTLSSKLEEISLHELIDVVEKDPVVVGRILSAANTVRHNPAITPLTGLAHAIHQLGLQKVRSIAVSMMLMENSAGKGNSIEQREASAQALCSGLIAQSCAKSLGSADHELLFASGMLRNLGAVILPAVSLEHCREAIARKAKMPCDIAYRGMFGMTPLELSRRLCVSMRMPEEVVQALRDCEPESMGGSGAQLSGRVLAIAEFSSQLSSILLSPTPPVGGFVGATHALAKKFERILPGVGAITEQAIEHANDQLHSLSQHGCFISSPIFLRLKNHSKAKNQSVAQTRPPHDPASAVSTGTSAGEVSTSAEAGDDILETAGESAVESAPVPEMIEPPVQEPSDATGEEDWTAQLSRSGAFEAQSTPPSTDSDPQQEDPWPAAIKAIMELMGCQHCVVFIGPKGGKRANPHRSIGGINATSQPLLTCTASDRTVFGVCLNRRETVLIHDGSDKALNNYLPEWLIAPKNRPGAFLLLPFSDEQPADGFVYLAWSKAHKITITAAQAALIRGLAGQHLGSALSASPSNARSS